MEGGTDLPQLFADEMGRLLGPTFPRDLGLAVSGGGDSMAMLYLAAPWARVTGIRLWPVTIDHGLRDGSAAEAEMVARASAELGLTHETLTWSWDGKGNLQEEARLARLSLLDGWRGDIAHILMAHTQDDVAETFLMRLARGSGVDGLASMADRHFARSIQNGDERVFEIIRPMLLLSRASLRHYLSALRIGHIDDPSNEDPRFGRVQMRQASEALAALGLTTERLAGTAARMGRAREVLGDAALAAHEAAVLRGPGDLLFDVTYDRDIFSGFRRELQLRLLAASLQFVSLNAHRPRLSALENALDCALSGGATTLHGGYVMPHRERLFITAEPAALKDVQNVQGTWRNLYKTYQNDVRMLGEAGAAQLRDKTDLPARVLWPCPAIWDGETVLATPRLGPNRHWNPEIPVGRFNRLLTRR